LKALCNVSFGYDFIVGCSELIVELISVIHVLQIFCLLTIGTSFYFFACSRCGCLLKLASSSISTKLRIGPLVGCIDLLKFLFLIIDLRAALSLTE
jgi:hypothetical protein